MKIVILLTLLLFSCATATQVHQLQQKQESTDRKIDEFLDKEVRRNCTLVVCGKEITAASVTFFECRHLIGMVGQIITKVKPNICEKPSSFDGVTALSWK